MPFYHGGSVIIAWKRKGHCYKLSVLTMQQFSIRKMRFPGFCHIPSCCSAAKHRSRTNGCL